METRAATARGRPAKTQPRLHAGSKKFARALAATEAAIHIALVEHLNARARPGTVWFHVPNGEARARATAGRLRAMGVKAGVPDLQFVAGGKVYFLELKREGGRLSEGQRDMIDALRKAGDGNVVVATAFGLDDALQTLTRWGVLR